MASFFFHRRLHTRWRGGGLLISRGGGFNPFLPLFPPPDDFATASSSSSSATLLFSLINLTTSGHEKRERERRRRKRSHPRSGGTIFDNVYQFDIVRGASACLCHNRTWTFCRRKNRFGESHDARVMWEGEGKREGFCCSYGTFFLFRSLVEQTQPKGCSRSKSVVKPISKLRRERGTPFL